MADRPEIKDYIDISDFTPGIHAGYNSLLGATTEPASDGAAQLVGTVGCIGYPNGGLGPLPREEFSKTLTLSDNATAPAYYSDEVRGVAILDIMSLPGVRPPDFLTTVAGDPASRVAHPNAKDYSGINDLFFMILERYYQPAGTGINYNRQWSARYHSLFLNPSMDAVDGHYGASNPYPIIDWTGTDDTAYRLDNYDFGFGCIDLGRDMTADPFTPGQPQFRFGFGGRLNIAAEDSGGFTGRSIYTYPRSGLNNQATPLLDFASATVLTSPCAVFSHQGRIVWASTSNTATSLPGALFFEGADWIVGSNSSAGIITSEELHWTKVNSVAPDNLTGTVFVEENPVGIGSWASMNSNELFMVKHQGGAVVVQGSLNNPTIVRLPGVQSTFGTVSHPVVTPLGCVYGTRSGVWVWNGSDTATCISPNLAGHFWKADNTDRFHPAQVTGRFAYHYPYIFAPGNWVCDIRTKGWFRLACSNGNTLAFFNSSFQGRVYGSPAFLFGPIIGASFSVPYLYAFNMEKGCNTFTWRSQPLQKTRNHRLDFRQLEIVAQGVGTISFALEGLDAAETKTYTFNVNSADRPVALLLPTSISSHDVVVTITSTATNPADQAPTLYRMSLGYRNAQSITPSGSVGGAP